MTLSADDQARIEREREFHNHEFADSSRERTSKYYEVAQAAWRAYEAAIYADCAGQRILEFGCGPGSYATVLARRGATVVGIDISEVAIEQARADAPRHGLGDALRFEVMNAEALTFASNTFDRVCGTAILHHLDLERALAELRRVLRPGGRAIFLEALGGNPLINWYRRRTPQMRTADEHPLIERELELMALHFDTVRIDRFGFATLAAVGFRRTPMFRPALAVLEAMDRAILSNHNLRHLAWMGLIDLR